MLELRLFKRHGRGVGLDLISG